jgi:hypothetical protein
VTVGGALGRVNAKRVERFAHVVDIHRDVSILCLVLLMDHGNHVKSEKAVCGPVDIPVKIKRIELPLPCG